MANMSNKISKKTRFFSCKMTIVRDCHVICVTNFGLPESTIILIDLKIKDD